MLDIMKKLQMFACALVGTVFLTSVAGAKPDELVLETNAGETRDGKSVYYYVTPEMAAKAPAYYPLSQKNPPLSMRRAIEIGLRAIQQRGKPPLRWRLSTVELNNYYVGNDGYPSGRPFVWYYSVQFVADCRPEQEQYGRWETVDILMDGSLAKERIEEAKPAIMQREGSPTPGRPGPKRQVKPGAGDPRVRSNSTLSKEQRWR